MTMTIDRSGAVLPGSAAGEGRESPRRIAAYVLLGASLVYLATWTGAVTFYLTFQKPLADGEAGSVHSVLWLAPGESVAAEPGGWGSHQEEGGLQIPLPPGKLLELTSNEGTIRARMEEGEVLITVHPRGFLASLLAEKLERIGGAAEAAGEDGAVLDQVAQQSLQDYSCRWPEARRQAYAARILAKMSLWDDRPVKRFERAHGPRGTAVLVENDGGETKVIAAGERSLLVVVIPAQAPVSWKASPASWLR